MWDFGKFLVGANYWPSKQGVHVWQEWNPRDIDREFRQMRALGLDTIRMFFVWQDFQPIKEIRGVRGEGNPLKVVMQHDETISTPEMVDERMVAKFDQMIEIARRHKIYLMPTFFVGWMSGTQMDVSWRKERNIFTDPTMLRYQCAFVRYFAQRYRNERQIIAWDLANEQNCFMDCPSHDAGWLWVSTLIKEIKLHDQNHPVTSGMHGLNITRAGKGGFMIGDVGEVVDFLTVHPYPPFFPECIDRPDGLRTTYFPSFQSKIYEAMGKKKVMCQEFGILGNAFVSRQIEARNIRTVLYSLVANGNLGGLFWCFIDLADRHRPPYDFNPVESKLGLVDLQGKPRPAGREMRRFARIVNKLDYAKLQPEKSKAAILVPWRHENREVLFNSFVLAKQAHLSVDFLNPEEPFDDYRILIIPSGTGHGLLTTSQWDRVKDFVKAGGVLYASYGGITMSEMDEVFGVEVQHRIRCQGGSRQITIAADDRCLRAGQQFNYQGAADWTLLVEPTSGEVMAENHEGQPVAIKHRYGKGWTVLLTEPIEIYLQHMPDVHDTDQSYLWYRYLKELAGIRDAFRTDDPRLELAQFSQGRGEKVLIVVNHDNRPIATSIKCRASVRSVIDLASGERIRLQRQGGSTWFPVRLAAKGGAIYRIRS